MNVRAFVVSVTLVPRAPAKATWQVYLSRLMYRLPPRRVPLQATPKPVPVPPAAPAAAPAGPAVSADRERLSATLAQYDLVERQVAGDGNCQVGRDTERRRGKLC